jgi:predicted phosphodiesterase
MLRPQTLILADLHLGPAAPGGTEEAAVGLLGRYPTADLICLGDLFDLSADARHSNAVESIEAYLGRFSHLTNALRKQLASGNSLTLVAGNHDAELGAQDVRRFLLRYLDASNPQAMTISPWFVRRGSIHLEHGHVWDEDNAPVHPLASPHRDEEPLGVALTRRVLAPTGAFQFAHAHQTTPLAGLKRALSDLGLRAPEVVLRYFIAGSRIFWRAVNRGHEFSAREGARRIAGFSRSQSLSENIVERLAALRPTPRQTDPVSTFARLYLDRATAAALGTTTAAGGLLLQHWSYLLPMVASFVYLAASRGNRAQRYSGWVERRLEAAALGIRPIMDARAVIFGHTHVPEARPGYVNTGSFGFSAANGRPFLLLDDADRITRGWCRGDEVEVEPLDRIVLGRARE